MLSVRTVREFGFRFRLPSSLYTPSSSLMRFSYKRTVTFFPCSAVELMKQPGIVGYIVKKEEQLWDIARHFHTTEAEIMETNGLKSADVQQGDKLLIVKKVSEC